MKQAINKTKQFLTAFIIFLFIIHFMGCGENSGGKSKALPPLSKEEITGKSLWERITSETNYTKYPYFPNHKGMRPGQAPHGRFHRIYINYTLENAIKQEEKITETPNGSIVIKENYTANQELAAITVMAKVEGFNEDHQDWFWAKYNPDGSFDKNAVGIVDPCINCHKVNKENDYLIIYDLKK